ncbi:magnesium transporter MRS2-F-like [Aristolochia californica]|uniref:magnesium transporter MRS2-F-like n=1 Tax=Aristolochia californica TaxID=171875 RepID=UPI0035D751A9
MAQKNSLEEQFKPSPVPHAPAQRRKAAGTTRTWLVISKTGGSHVEDVGKHSIMRRTGLPGRDLRILDPMLSYPSTILGREKAIVVKLEHIKAIITATEALVLNPKDPGVEEFVKDLEYRVSNLPGTPQLVTESDPDIGSPSILDHGSASPSNIVVSEMQHLSSESSTIIPDRKEGGAMPIPALSREVGTKILPFEFRVLEVCLESACRCLESETTTLEKEAYPALDELTSKISTLNLERVRQIKSRLVAISGRVQKVRDELEHLLDDDMDMAEMHLTEKLADEQYVEAFSKEDNIDDADADADDNAFEVEDGRYAEYNKSKSKSFSESVSDFKPNIEELEMLLEAYFVQIEGTLNKLSTMREYVDDTEDYINIMLDDKQNQLLQMGVMLSTATLVISIGIVVTGIFGMNITIELFSSSNRNFLETTFGTVAGCLALYVIAIVFGKKKGLIG